MVWMHSSGLAIAAQWMMVAFANRPARRVHPAGQVAVETYVHVLFTQVCCTGVAVFVTGTRAVLGTCSRIPHSKAGRNCVEPTRFMRMRQGTVLRTKTPCLSQMICTACVALRNMLQICHTGLRLALVCCF